MSQEGIEIHFDEKRGYLQLACEPDAFAPYREIAREQLKDFPDISIDRVIEMNIVDTATFVSRREAPKNRFWDFILVFFVIVVLSLAIFGVYALITKFA
jgi:hypothetical protein